MGALDGKVAVITGASRGLGLGIATAYVQAGATVVLVARSEKTVCEAAQSLTDKGFRTSAFPCDISQLSDVEALAHHAIDNFGRIDVWVNNAGIADIYGPTASVPIDRFVGVINTNIIGTYYGSVVAMRCFLKQGSGKLINLLGRGDDKPVPMQNAYASSKVWIRHFTLALAEEYKASGIGVYAFNPGLVDTEMLRKVDAIEGYEAKLSGLSTVIRWWGNPPEVPSERAVWLASAATDGKTGLEVNVLDRKAIFSGLIRDVGRRIARKPAVDTTLEVRTIKPETAI